MSPSQAAAPVATSFQDYDLDPRLERAVAAEGYETPRPIQASTIPAVLEGRDVLGLAQTGTGKTVAFALPTLERLLAAPRRASRVLVVAPTRELALQIDDEFRTLARFTRLKTATVYGGVSERKQVDQLRRNPEVIVACPGRLLDLYRSQKVRLDRIETLVLDEADHMFDMGFLPDIKRIIAALPKKRQTLLFAATMVPEIRKLADQTLHQPLVAELEHSTPASTIEHALYPVAEKRKLALLRHFLVKDNFVSAIVFTRTKYRARRVADQLGKRGHKAVALQGNMSQGQRDRAMKGFRDGRYHVLVATDIASRGIDVDQVSHVINYDVPSTPDIYTHRIGRTGRSERSGRAYTFVTDQDRSMVRSIERRIGSRIERGKVEGFDATEESGESLERPQRNTYGGPRGRGDATNRASRRSGGRPGGGRPRRGPRQDGTWNDGPQRDRTRRDAARRDGAAQRDGARRAGARRDGAQRDGARRDGARRDGAQRDGARRDGARRDGARRDGARQDGAQRDGSRRDGSRNSTPQRSSNRPGNSNRPGSGSGSGESNRNSRPKRPRRGRPTRRRQRAENSSTA